MWPSLSLLLLVALTAAAAPDATIGYQIGNHYITWSEMISRLREISEIENESTTDCGFLEHNEVAVECRNNMCKKHKCEGGQITTTTDCDDNPCDWGNWSQCCGRNPTFRWRRCLNMSNPVKCIGNTLEKKTCGYCNCSSSSSDENTMLCRPSCKGGYDTVNCQETINCNQNHPPCSESVMLQVHGDSYDWRDTPHETLQSTAVDDMSVDREPDVAAEIVEKLLKMYYNDKR